jgi:clathrin heavy chain
MVNGVLTTREVFQLNNVQGGLRPGAINFKSVSLESDRFACVRDLQPDGQTSLAVVDIERSESERHNIKDAEAAIMNPRARILALRSGNNLQIFNLEVRQRLKSATMNDGVVFWKWISPTLIVIVTNASVYHWTTEGQTEPEKVFDRATEIDAGVQILNYHVDADMKWYMLNGVARTDAGLAGKTQLYTVENNQSRVLDGHAGCFISMATPNDARLSNLMCLAWSTPQGGQLLMMELPVANKPDSSFERKMISLPITTQGDFPVFARVSPQHKLLTVITSRGLAIVVDVISGTLIASEQVTPHVIFCGTPWEKTGGALCINNQGSVFHVSINNDVIARHINGTLHNPEMALRIASNANLGGVDELFRAQLQNLVAQGNVPAAIDVCHQAPNNILRTPDVLQRFMAMPQQPGQPPAISVYFKTMLGYGALNAAESMELAKVVLQKGGSAYVKQQFEEGKLEVTEELADLVQPHDGEVAMKMYHGVKAHHKVVNIFLSRNETDKAVAYCQRVEYNPDWRLLLMNFVRVNPADAVNLAVMLHKDMGAEPVINPNDVVEMFLPGQNIREATEFLIAVLKDNKTPETSGLQTRLLEINLRYSPPNVAEKILAQGFCPFHDAGTVAPLCERANLFQYALEGYNRMQEEGDGTSQLPSMKRCLAHTDVINPGWLLEFFGKLSQADSLQCLAELMINRKANFQTVVQIATKYNDALGADKLIDMFLDGKAFEILYYYLGAVVPYSRDPEIHFRYIEASAEVGQIVEVERMTRESPCYDAVRTKNYLKEKALDDLWPLINVCDKNDFIDELVKFLLDSKNPSFIEQYVQRRNPLKTPQVIVALLEYDASESMIKGVLDAAGSMCPIDELVEQVEARGRLKMLRSFLEARAAEKRTDSALHNALAKIYIEINEGVEKFLESNEFYDALIVGQYCETRDPSLALVAYMRGNCHDQIIEVSIKNGMWKPLAKHLVAQKDSEMWATVLNDKSFDPRYLVEAVRRDALAESKVQEEVVATVRAFMAADMTHEMTTILDQVVMGGQFQKNKYLENLLVFSAIKARPDKVMEYVNRLECYDPVEIGSAAVQAGLHDAAFAVYEKAELKKEAMSVLLNEMDDVPRARGFAVEANDAAVWTVFGKYMLRKDDLHEAIEAFITAKNAEFVPEVVTAADRVNQFGDLIKYLTMARSESKSKDPQIDTYLVLTFAKTGRLSDLEDFLKNTTHSVQVIAVADKCFVDALYDSARVLYTAASNFPKLASTLIRLTQWSAAVDAAQKAQNVKTYKEVAVACLAADEVEAARVCSVAVAAHAEELTFLVTLYESAGLFEELQNVLKAALSHQGAHMSLYTELGILFAKFKPEKLLEHVKLYPKKINTHKMIHACNEYHHWLVLRVLHVNNEDWLAAAHSMMEHPTDSWDHETFSQVLQKLGASDVCYQAITFYVKHAPSQLHDLLMTLAKKIDCERVMHEVKKSGAPLSFVKGFLEAMQDRNVRRVNDELNSIYVEEEDFAALRKSVDSFANFDSADLSASLETMELFEFRRIALMLHRRNKRYFHAVEVAKQNDLYTDAIEAASESKDTQLVESLLLHFCELKRADCFSACLYLCYDFVQPHVVLELAWLHDMQDAAMPFVIQSTQELHERVAGLQKTMGEAKKQAQEARAAAGPVGPTTGAPLMIGGPSAPPMGGGGMF